MGPGSFFLFFRERLNVVFCGDVLGRGYGLHSRCFVGGFVVRYAKRYALRLISYRSLCAMLCSLSCVHSLVVRDAVLAHRLHICKGHAWHADCRECKRCARHDPCRECKRCANDAGTSLAESASPMPGTHLASVKGSSKNCASTACAVLPASAPCMHNAMLPYAAERRATAA